LIDKFYMYIIQSDGLNEISSNQLDRLVLVSTTLAEKRTSFGFLTDNYHQRSSVNKTINIHQGGPFCLGEQL
jgi:hypothetical protein